jgi:uncharacterized membrane protein YidH (DUF202 family)
MLGDIAIAVGLLAVAVIMAYLGVRVTLHPPTTPPEKRNYKLAFLILGVFAGVLTVVQGILNWKSQHDLMEAIKNGKPPVVNVLPSTATIQVTTAPPPLVLKAAVSLVQSPLPTQAIEYPWQRKINLDKPGASAIVTASGELKHPLFIFKCSVPCMYLKVTASQLVTWLTQWQASPAV